MWGRGGGGHIDRKSSSALTILSVLLKGRGEVSAVMPRDAFPQNVHRQ
jgi:hypothetical protein